MPHDGKGLLTQEPSEFGPQLGTNKNLFCVRIAHQKGMSYETFALGAYHTVIDISRKCKNILDAIG